MTIPSVSLQILKKEEAIPWPGTLAIVHSYIAYKEGDSRFPSSLHVVLGGLFAVLTAEFCCSKRRGETEADEVEL